MTGSTGARILERVLESPSHHAIVDSHSRLGDATVVVDQILAYLDGGMPQTDSLGMVIDREILWCLS